MSPIRFRRHSIGPSTSIASIPIEWIWRFFQDRTGAGKTLWLKSRQLPPANSGVGFITIPCLSTKHSAMAAKQRSTAASRTFDKASVGLGSPRHPIIRPITCVERARGSVAIGGQEFRVSGTPFDKAQVPPWPTMSGSSCALRCRERRRPRPVRSAASLNRVLAKSASSS